MEQVRINNIQTRRAIPFYRPSVCEIIYFHPLSRWRSGGCRRDCPGRQWGATKMRMKMFGKREKLFSKLWERRPTWDGCVSNKLHSVKPLLGYSNLSSLSCQDAVVLRRLRIGHTRLANSYLLNRQGQPCPHCDCALTVAHVLLECNHYNVVRQRYFNVSSLHELFDTVNAQSILGFIRDIGLYRLL